MIRFFAEISYRGLDFNGFQIQTNGKSVQETLSDALCKVLREDNVVATGSGRTDTGVHALQQFVHFESESLLPEQQVLDALSHRLNGLLRGSIVVHKVFAVADDSHARFSARSRRYHYLITKKPIAHAKGLAAYYGSNLKLDLMNVAAQILLEHEDFQCFSRVKTAVNHFRCHLTTAHWTEKGNFLIFEIEADRFLRGMVRAIVGTLLDIGSGKTTLRDLKTILDSKDRKLAGSAAPPYGLYLSAVRYPEGIVPDNLEDPRHRLVSIL
jgi:tRNA pseudouridine38-40 synthase